MRQAKIILYPIFGVYQFCLAAENPSWWPLFVIVGIGLIGLAILHLFQADHSE